ncbi:MAG TPA: hypothetical protein DCL35_01580 [Candidatus Omnitrophica bacterium]|nr:hypothetical protein [Candidatus Omnitrophota bacterium]
MSFNENIHSVVVRSDPAAARSEILWWGEASWWPANCLMRFVRLTERPVQKGTRYRQEVLLPFAPTWEVEIENVTDTSITRRFLNGMFKGSETISLVPSRGTVEIIYRMHYEVQGLVNSLLWALFFKNLHDRNIKMILASLKGFLEKGNRE